MSSGSSACVKLASNEGPFGPFPGRARGARRAPRRAEPLPRRRRLAPARRARRAARRAARGGRVGAGADGLIDCLSQATLDPGDEIVCGWPSFPSYVIDAREAGRGARRRCRCGTHRYDLDAMLEAIGPRTKLVYVCHPNNPTGTMNTRAELDAFLDAVPGHVLVVIDQAYREYVDDPDYPDAIEEYYKAGRPIAVLRTFSKIYGLAGLRVGYMVAPAGGRHRGEQGQARVRRLERGAGGRARQPRRPGRDRAPPAASTPRAMAELGRHPPRPRPRACRAGGRELPLRRRRRRLAAAVRGAAPGGRDRAPAARLRRAERDPRHRAARRTRHEFFADALAGCAQQRACALTSRS